MEGEADYTPMMPPERAEQLRVWHEQAYQDQRTGPPAQMRFMGLDLRIDEDVFAPHADKDGQTPSTRLSPTRCGRARGSWTWGPAPA